MKRAAPPRSRPRSRRTAVDAVQVEVFGEACGSDGYTTPAEARSLARRLRLRKDARVLDIGTGSGWPGVRVAELSAARVILTDVPVAGVAKALERSARTAIADRCEAALASGEALPFRDASFDGIVHADVLC